MKILFVCCHTQILYLRAKINFVNMLKIVRKLGQFLNLPDFRIIPNILKPSQHNSHTRKVNEYHISQVYLGHCTQNFQFLNYDASA